MALSTDTATHPFPLQAEVDEVDEGDITCVGDERK